MKKRYLYTALFFEIAACVGAYFVQYFTARKLGMLRWINHLCNKWSRYMDLDQFHLIMMILVSGFALALLIRTMKKMKEKSFCLSALAATAFSGVGIYLVWTVRYTRRLMAAYYLVCPILLLGAVIALLCWALAVSKKQ